MDERMRESSILPLLHSSILSRPRPATFRLDKQQTELETMLDLPLIFAAGLLGGAHCVGMCGGFVLALGTTSERGASLVHQACYFIGKTLTYTVMGAAVGLVGSTVGAHLASVQDAISIAAGGVMLVIGLGLVGALRRVGGFGVLMNRPRFRRAVRYFTRKRTRAGALGVGLMNGLLPCGMVYGMLAMAAASGTLLGGALTMFVFGIATVPALLVLGLAGHLIRPAWRHRIHRASGAIVLLLGLITVLRATPAMHLFMSH